ncbi:MAG: pyruvate dehydrogenase (acetyl-transferring) E1 component subunit alpha [Chlamydiia bacterium]|nr:pyruvate dehydrogenase (acetyl-transferring) E1 component subunit alpha [Chlamydiia bacterium]
MAQAHASSPNYHFFPFDQQKVMAELGPELLLDSLRKMLRIRHLETRAEAAYLSGKIGGFFHSYIGQEALATACTQVLGPDHWYVTSYRCHAWALLLGASPNEIMSELYGRANGNAKGRGGSMHLFTDRLLGGHGIVGGQCPIGVGAGFSIKYRGLKDEVAICFMGDGAVAQGAFHESLNLASLWNLPCIFVIENNHWGMGTAVNRAISVKRLAEDRAQAYNMKAYTLDGMNFFACYAGFEHILQETLETSRPVLVEAVTERFKGHSISDPGLYRSKEELQACKNRDPIDLVRDVLMKAGVLSEDAFKAMDKELKEEMVAAMQHADESAWPDPVTLEEDVYAP